MTPDPRLRLPSDSRRELDSRLTRILVIDDEPEVHRIVARALGEGYSYEFARSVKLARKRLSTTSFGLAFCDLEIMGERGFDLIEEIVCDHPATAVVLLTRLDDPEAAERALNLRPNGYLVKPFLARQLLCTMMNALNQRDSALDREAALARQEATVVRVIGELRSLHQETVERLVGAIEMHDPETGEHVSRMASITVFLADRLELDPDRVLLLRAAAPMHDVGKIAIAEAILRKPDPLTSSEREQMERHTTIGHELFADSDSDLLQMAATIALTHHERWDGGGYPQGLSGEEIPIEGRIVAIVDVFDALLSDRCYWPAMSADAVAETIREGRGTQFDPMIVDVLLENFEEALLVRG